MAMTERAKDMDIILNLRLLFPVLGSGHTLGRVSKASLTTFCDILRSPRDAATSRARSMILFTSLGIPPDALKTSRIAGSPMCIPPPPDLCNRYKM